MCYAIPKTKTMFIQNVYIKKLAGISIGKFFIPKNHKMNTKYLMISIMITNFMCQSSIK